MKKFFLVLSVIAFAASNVFASNLVKITRITNSIQIKRPDNGEVNVYKDLNDIPKLMYGSKILATGGTAEIQLFNTASVTLEKNQEILILKHPVSQEVEISKTERMEKKPKNSDIKVWLAGYASVSFGSDTRITFQENYPSIVLKVARGIATVKGAGGKTYEIRAGEYYEAKQNLVK